MKVWLYSQLLSSPGNALFMERCEARGVEASLYKPGAATLTLNETLPQPAPLVFVRAGGAASASDIDELVTLSELGARCVNEVTAIRKTRHKGVAYANLAKNGVPIPRSVLTGREGLMSALEMVPGPPWILKLPLSTKGAGVCLVETKRSAISTFDALTSLHSGGLLVQEFVTEAKGSDVRVIVMGGKAVLAARRQASTADEFRSNVHLGGQASLVELTPDLVEIAEKASDSLGLQIAGVDIIQGAHGYLVVEVNSSPGLTASPDLPDLVLDYLLRL